MKSYRIAFHMNQLIKQNDIWSVIHRKMLMVILKYLIWWKVCCFLIWEFIQRWFLALPVCVMLTRCRQGPWSSCCSKCFDSVVETWGVCSTILWRLLENDQSYRISSIACWHSSCFCNLFSQSVNGLFVCLDDIHHLLSAASCRTMWSPNLCSLSLRARIGYSLSNLY